MASAGQAPEVPVHFSAWSHTPDSARQILLEGKKVQVPLAVAPLATLQAWQSVSVLPPQELLQQNPSTQNLLLQPELAVQTMDLTAILTVVETVYSPSLMVNTAVYWLAAESP